MFIACPSTYTIGGTLPVEGTVLLELPDAVLLEPIGAAAARASKAVEEIMAAFILDM